MEGIRIVGDNLLNIMFVAGGYITIIGGIITSLKFISKGDAHNAMRSILSFGVGYGCIRFLPWVVKMIDQVFSTM